MSDPIPTSPLATKALQRLRKLAEGNGLAPDAIHLFSAEEKVYAIEGTLTLSPLFETQSGRYPGGPRRHNYKGVSSAELKTEVETLRKNFETKHSWINEAIAQLKEQPAGGWGLDDVRITLPSQSTVLAATENCPTCQGSKSLTCPQCQGNGGITCPQCQGRRQELCHICLGSGLNPSHPGMPCIECNGLLYTACRFCHGNGQLTCPTCHGKRGTVCSACNGAGGFTEEVIVSCGARTHFTIKSDGLPSGLRRGLDRLGMANLAKGHADIESLAPPPDEEDETPVTPPIPGAKVEEKKEKPPKPELHYLAHMPYADLRMSFAGKKVIVGVFGKNQTLLGVPPFLDIALEPAREKLKQAAKGGGNLEGALDMRVMKDALKLQLAGQGNEKALRRIYPHGLSPQAANEILANMRLALNRLTLRSRSLVAALCAMAGGGVFAAIYLTPLRSSLTQGWKPMMGAAFDAGILLAVLAACWFALSATIRLALQKRFPDSAIPITQKTGKTGMTMLAAILVFFAVIILLAPARPEWLQPFLALQR